MTTTTTYDQTWDLLERALESIVYTRDPLPDGHPRFRLRRDDGANYAVLFIFTYNPNTYRPDEMRHTRHEFVVPCATYHEEAWRRWVFDRILAIETHETCESFQVILPDICRHCGSGADPDGDHTCPCPYRDEDCPTHTGPRTYRPYAPHHGNGWDPYTFWPEHDPAEKAKAPGDD